MLMITNGNKTISKAAPASAPSPQSAAASHNILISCLCFPNFLHVSNCRADFILHVAQLYILNLNSWNV